MRAVLAAALALLALQQGAVAPGRTAPAAIYSNNQADPWNQIFALLFTRDVKVRFTSEFIDRGPFEDQPSPALQYGTIRLSTRTFDRHEDGDHAVEALYPVFMTGEGVRAVLEDPRYAELSDALAAALSEHTPRSSLARALMQMDLWSAFDRLASVERVRGPARSPMHITRASALRSLIARMIGRIALTPTQIAALPDNYEAARRTLSLPDAFHGAADWLEVAWADFHMHEQEADQRRVTRAFMRPAGKPSDVSSFLKAATREFPPNRFDAVALVTRAMLLDSSGRVVASPLATDIQVRTFSRDGRGTVVSAKAVQHELSRRRLLSNAASGGFVTFADQAEAYLPSAGNDYDFATPVFGTSGPAAAVISTLRERCGGCHGRVGIGIASFSVMDPEALPPPRALPQPNTERARAVAAAKESRDDFKRLIEAAGLRR
jgi:hypothetical protein